MQTFRLRTTGAKRALSNHKTKTAAVNAGKRRVKKKFRSAVRRASLVSKLGMGAASKKKGRDDDEDGDRSFVAPETLSLRQHLNAQLSLTKLGRRDRALIGMLIDALDDDGYLTQPLAEIALLLPPEAREATAEEIRLAMPSGRIEDDDAGASGQAVAGAVYNPATEEMFEATLGGGARLNGRPVAGFNVVKVDAASEIDVEQGTLCAFKQNGVLRFYPLM